MATRDPLQLLDAALGEGRRRLRLRGALRGAAVGAWVGAGLAVTAGLVRQLGLVEDRPAVLAAVAALVVAALAGAAVGVIRRTLPDRETALLLDRTLGTDEVLVTATWLRTIPPGPHRDRVLDRLAETAIPSIPKALPLQAPRHARWLPLPLVAALAALLAPAWRPALAMRAAASDDPVAQEGLKLAERLAEVAEQEGVELPAGLETELAELARGMQGETLSPEEAKKRLEELQSQLDAFEQSLAAQRDALEELEKAADTLKDNPATRELGEALSDLDLGAAGDAASQLASELGVQSPLQRQQAAEALQQAGQQLAQSQDPAMQQAGQAMQQAAQEVAAQPGGEPGPQGEPGQQPGGQQPGGQQPGGQQQPGGGDGLSPEEAQQLAEALQQARAAGEQLAKDEAALKRSQELNGAMEGSRQRLGGEPGTEDGEGQGTGSGEGEGQGEGEGEGEGEGDGQGEGEGEGQGEGGQAPGGQAASGVGDGHTWEDQGEFDDPTGASRAGRDTARDDPGKVINDFERLYKSVRDQDAEHLLTSVPGELDRTGHVDQIPIRLTGSEETAKTSVIQLPPSYREAAADAVSSEQVPPGYREAVKQYFDDFGTAPAAAPPGE